MAKTKYTPELIELIERILAETGSDITTYRAAGITAETFYAWIRQRPDFSERVAKAKKAFRDKNNPQKYIDKAHQQIEKLLENGSQETWESETFKIEVVDGEEVLKAIERGKKRVQRDVPYWVLERVMGPSREAIDLLAYLFTEGAIADEHRIAVARFLRRAAPLLTAEIKETIAIELDGRNPSDS